jgi:hypothetical protein
MNGRNVPFFFRNLELIVHCSLIYDSIFLKCKVHVQGYVFPFPSVTFCMNVDLLIPSENFVDRLLFRNFKQIFGIAQCVNDTELLRLFGEFSDEVVLVFPPGNHHEIFFEIKM